MTCSITRMLMPLVADLPEHFDDFVDLDEIQPGHHFVTQQHLGLHGERFGEFKPLAVGAAEFLGALRRELAETDEVELGAGFLARFGEVALARAVAEQRADRDVVEHATGRETAA